MFCPLSKNLLSLKIWYNCNSTHFFWIDDWLMDWLYQLTSGKEEKRVKEEQRVGRRRRLTRAPRTRLAIRPPAISAWRWFPSRSTPPSNAHQETAKMVRPYILSIFFKVYLSSFCLSIFLYIYLSIYLSIFLSFYLSTHLSIYLSINLSFYLSVNSSFYLSTHFYSFLLSM